MSLVMHRCFRGAAAGAALLAAACATSPHAVDSTPAGAAPRQATTAPALVYVCNQNDASVSVIDAATNRVVRVVDLTRLGFSKNAKPHHIAVEPDGSHWYVTLIGEGKIAKFDRNDRLVGTAPFETPGMLALHPTEDLMFVGRSMTAVNPPQRIGVVTRSTMAIEEVEVLFPRPHAMILNPESGHVYTASLAVNSLAAMDVRTQAVQVTPVSGPQHALMQFALSPDGKTLAASAELSHQVLFFDLADPMRPTLTGTVEVGQQPFDPVYTPDGRWLYLGNKAANTVTVLDARTRSVAKVVRGEGIAQPHGTAVSPDGRTVYVSNNNLGGDAHAMHAMPSSGAAPAAAPTAAEGGPGTVVAIDIATQQVTAVIPVGRNASGIATATRPARP